MVTQIFYRLSLLPKPAHSPSNQFLEENIREWPKTDLPACKALLSTKPLKGTSCRGKVEVYPKVCDWEKDPIVVFDGWNAVKVVLIVLQVVLIETHPRAFAATAHHELLLIDVRHDA